MRIKTINSIVKEIKMVDGHSAVKQGILRVLIATNRLDFFHRGNRLVIDADKLPDDINLLFGIDGNKAIPRIRSIHNAFLELRKISPELGVSEEISAGGDDFGHAGFVIGTQ